LTLTYSRSAWLGFLVGMGLWAMVRRSWKIFAFFTFLFIFILTPMAVSKRVLPESNLLIQSHEAAPESPRNDVAKLEHSESDLLIKRPEVVSRGAVVASGKGIFGRFLDILDRGLSSSDRLHYWEAAVRIIKDHPLTGAGLNTYSKVINEYSSYYHFYVHNCYLQVAAELGLPGLAVLLWVLFTPLVYALRRIRAIADPLWSGILGAVAAGYIAVLAESALDTTFYSVQLSTMIWIVMALLVAIPRACEAK
jgi:O-antigen ligase